VQLRERLDILRNARQILPSAAVAVLFLAIFSLTYRHLIFQAYGQGFVLQELAPLMNAAVGAGGELSSWGRYNVTASIVAVIFCCLTVAAGIVARSNVALRNNLWLFLIAIGFSFMLLPALTESLFVYIAVIPAVIILGWIGQRNCGASQTVSMGGSARAVLVSILAVGLLVRLYQLDVFPTRYTIDEQLFARAALEIGDDPAAFFSQPHYSKPYLIKILAIRLAFWLAGVGLFQHRSVSAVEGTLSILLLYFLVRQTWGNRAAVFAAFLLAVDPWHIGYSKFGVHEIEGPLFLILLFFFVFRAAQNGGRKNFAVLGLLTGATLYLYLANAVMAPFAFAAALGGSILLRKVNWTILAGEAASMTAAFLLVLTPHLTFGRENVQQLLSIYSSSSNFIVAAQYHGMTPVSLLLANLWSGVETLFQWVRDPGHPAPVFRPNPIVSGLALLGVGILIARKNGKDLLILLWIPVAFLPAAVGFGFEERRLFATLVPIPAMLAGIVLAHLWESGKISHFHFSASISKVFVLLLLCGVLFSGMFITFVDTDSSFGRSAQPRKAAEFIRSLPPSHSIIISSRIKESPFLIYLMNYDKIDRRGAERTHSFADIEELLPQSRNLAATRQLVLLLDPGVREQELLDQIQQLNPYVKIIKSRDFWACIIDDAAPGVGREGGSHETAQ